MFSVQHDLSSIAPFLALFFNEQQDKIVHSLQVFLTFLMSLWCKLCFLVANCVSRN